MQKKRIGIVGATGFTGSELVRILHHHPNVEITVITSESRQGEPFSAVHPFFRGIVDTPLDTANNIANYDLDLVFLALPHGVSMEYVKKFREQKFDIIDLSGDFRLDNPDTYTAWYNKTHSYPSGFEEAVYGIPELYRDQIAQSRLIANPGCYPTSVTLGIAPLLKAGWADVSNIIADSKSGVTGAGVKAKSVNMYSNVNDNFRAYGVKTHRHSIEIQEQANALSGAEAIIQFTPHLLPVDRGILSTIYLRLYPEVDASEETVREVYKAFYRDAPFVRLTEQPPAIKEVRGTNYCDIYTTFDKRTGNVIVVSVIDNLVKGAAGQAVQNMNVRFGLDEKIGLDLIPLVP